MQGTLARLSAGLFVALLLGAASAPESPAPPADKPPAEERQPAAPEKKPAPPKPPATGAEPSAKPSPAEPKKPAAAKAPAPAKKAPPKTAEKSPKSGDKAAPRTGKRKDTKPKPASPDKPADKKPDKPADKPAEKSADKPAEKAAEKPADKTAEKPAERAPEKPAEKPAGNAPLASLERACERLGGRLRSVGFKTCMDAGLRTSLGSSVDGQPLLYRDYLPSSRRATPHRVLLIGGIHGDELSSVSVVFQWMQRLSQEKFQPFHWRVIPCANPDGLLKRPPTRVNAHGVDLNRNFPTEDWNADALAYWKKKTGSDPRRYPGKEALSEPESRWLTRMIKQFKPDAIVSIHAPFGVLDYDGPRQPPSRFGYLHLHLLGTYPGSLGNFAGVNLGLPVITLELPHAGIMPTPQQSQRVWSDMLTWLERNLPKYEPALYMRLEDHPWNGGE